MIPVQDLIEWLSAFSPECSVGVDEGGLQLHIVKDGALTGAYYEIGGIPEDIKQSEE